jgi:hypothetical protein
MGVTQAIVRTRSGSKASFPDCFRPSNIFKMCEFMATSPLFLNIYTFSPASIQSPPKGQFGLLHFPMHLPDSMSAD